MRLRQAGKIIGRRVGARIAQHHGRNKPKSPNYKKSTVSQAGRKVDSSSARSFKSGTYKKVLTPPWLLGGMHK